MRNEYTDYIAHGHKYFAVVDLGKKNSKGTKLRRYFYSANEYKNYLQGKKTLDDKLLGGVSKVANKLSGVKAIGKGLASTSKAIRNTNKEIKALKKQGYSEEAARDEIKAKSTNQAMKRAGLSSIGPVGYTSMGFEDSKGNYSFKKKAVIEGTDSRGKKYYAVEGSRQIAQSKDNNPVTQKRAMREAENLARTKTGRSDNMKTMISEQRADINKERHEKNKANLKAHPEKSILNNPIRENFTERLIEKGINKANAEAMRKKLEETYKKATTIGTAANNLKGRLDKLQEAMTSGDGDKLLDTMDEMLKDQENIQKDVLDIVDTVMPDVKKTADTFLDMGKKTLDTATAGPKAVVGDKDVKTFENSSTTWDDVKESNKTPTVNNSNKTTTFDDAVKNGKTKVENAINNASSKPKETTNKETNSKKNSKYYIEYKAGDSKKEWIDKALELGDSIHDKYEAEYKAAKKEKDKEKMAKIKEEWNMALAEAAEANQETMDSIGYNAGDFFYTIYKDLINNLSRK